MHCAPGKKSTTKKINNDMKIAKRRAIRQFKVLLLGTGDSGKSTVFKQMKLLYGTDSDNSITDQVLHDSLPFCLKSILFDVQNLVKAISAGGREKAKIPKDFPMLGEEAEKAAQVIRRTSSRGNKKPSLIAFDENGFKPEVANAIKVIWSDETVQRVWESLRSNLQVSESFAYFADKVSEEYPTFAGPGWTPTDEEYLLTRNQTVGVHQCEFLIEAIKAGRTNQDPPVQQSSNKNQSKLILIDVGGQKAERRKWLKVFDGIPVVLFVTALSEYDQVLWEDTNKNRMVDSLEVFKEVVNKEIFHDTSFIVFLNKADVFRDKLCNKKIPLNTSGEFPDAPDTFDYDEGVEWVRSKFNSLLENGQDVVYHVTTATDRENAKNVLGAVAHSVFTNVIQPWFGNGTA